MRFLTLSAAAVFALAISSGVARAHCQSDDDAFTISGGSAYTLPSTSGPTPIPVGTTGYTDALLTLDSDAEARVYRFEFLGCGDTKLGNRFYVSGTHKFFDCATSNVGDSFTAHLKVSDVGPHSPFHFQSAANLLGPSVFNGEGPFNGTYTNGKGYANTSIFYAIDGSTSNPAPTSGSAVVLGLADGGTFPTPDNDYQDLDVRITPPVM
jgi:hypothetical protein